MFCDDQATNTEVARGPKLRLEFSPKLLLKQILMSYLPCGWDVTISFMILTRTWPL